MLHNLILLIVTIQCTICHSVYCVDICSWLSYADIVDSVTFLSATGCFNYLFSVGCHFTIFAPRNDNCALCHLCNDCALSYLQDDSYSPFSLHGDNCALSCLHVSLFFWFLHVVDVYPAGSDVTVLHVWLGIVIVWLKCTVFSPVGSVALLLAALSCETNVLHITLTHHCFITYVIA